MNGENNTTKEKTSNDKVNEAIVTIEQYMKEHKLKSHAFKGHADVFFNELKYYMKLHTDYHKDGDTI
tara:strand:+ start:452 stop:652 length:201 start_codon:yes stop_codon:yes gene_type:complete